MNLKVQHVYDATLVVAQIIREGRPMPLKGKYRLARLHSKLLPEFNTISARRDEMIKAYGYHPMVPGPFNPEDPTGQSQVESEAFAVPADKMEEWNAAWKEIGDEQIEVDVQPIPLGQLDLGDAVDGSITANELITLGDLVSE